ncbi:MAG TPA: gliding motility-associated C-terminal domain-containing protein, partial [Puia sp.]|nr:gliding motility-associated C-terminal domain-containing protein [Puia sp.]
GDFGNNWSVLSPYTPYVQKDNWFCLVYTFDGTNAKFYVNGILINSYATNIIYSPDASDLFFGRLNNAIFPYWLNGVLDEVRIYDRAINQQEVNALCTLCSLQGSFIGSEICEGDNGSLTFQASSGTAPFTIVYTDGTSNFTQNNVQSGVSFATSTSPISNTTYKIVNATDALGCSTPTIGDDTANLIVHPRPQAKLSDQTICTADPAEFVFSAQAGTPPFNITYAFGLNGYAQNSLANSSTFPSPFALTDTTTFILKSVRDAFGCLNSVNLLDSIVVFNVNLLPQGSILGSSGCSGDSSYLTFVATAGIAPFTLSFSDGANVIFASGIISNKSFALPNTLNTTDKSYTLLSINDNNGTGCMRLNGFTAGTATITVIPGPMISFDNLPDVCKNDPAFVIIQAKENSGMTGSGIFSGRGVTSNGLFSPSGLDSGSYSIQYRFTGTNGCADSLSRDILVKSIPFVNLGPDIIACMNSGFQLHVSGAASYLWTPSTGISDPASADPIMTASATTTYVLQATSAQGCKVTDSLTVIVSPLGREAYRVPNAFTPNGDGNNDCFGIQRWGGIELLEFTIYNRWGQRVFSTKNPSECWNGSLHGVPQDSGGFVYIIRAITPCGNINLHGTVLLIR